jgi:hypothetical protein
VKRESRIVRMKRIDRVQIQPKFKRCTRGAQDKLHIQKEEGLIDCTGLHIKHMKSFGIFTIFLKGIHTYIPVRTNNKFERQKRERCGSLR